MEKWIVWIFVFAMSFVFAADEWGDINDGSSEDEVSSTSGSGSLADNVATNDYDSSGDGKFYTSEFYVALGLIVLAFLIIGVFCWLWLRGPKNKWEK